MFSTVSADVPAPVGAGASEDTVLTKFRSSIYIPDPVEIRAVYLFQIQCPFSKKNLKEKFLDSVYSKYHVCLIASRGTMGKVLFLPYMGTLGSVTICTYTKNKLLSKGGSHMATFLVTRSPTVPS